MNIKVTVYPVPMTAKEFFAAQKQHVPVDILPTDPGFMLIHHKDTVKEWSTWVPANVIAD